MKRLYEIQGKTGFYKEPQLRWLQPGAARKFVLWGYRVTQVNAERDDRLGILATTQDVKSAKRARYTQDELAESAILRQRKDRSVISADDIIDVMLALNRKI